MRRPGIAAALAALALLAGCGGGTRNIAEGGRVIGDTLTVYSLLPQPGLGAARDVVDGERLALREAGGRAGPFTVNFASLDALRQKRDLPEDAVPRVVAATTRDAMADPRIIAVIGDLGDDTARVTVPLFNSAGILHVSPGAIYPGFTRPVAPGEPERFYPAGERTFFPLAPDAVAQAQALADGLEGRVLVEQEESPTGRVLGAALRSALGTRRLARDAGEADAAVYAGTDPVDAAGVVDGLLRENRRLTVHLPTPLAGTPVARRRRVVALSAQPPPSRALRRAFRDAYGREATPAAVAGYEAMRAVLAALARAGERAARRSAVIRAYREGPPPPERLSALGRGGAGRAGLPAR